MPEDPRPLEPEELVKRFYRDLWERGELDAAHALCHPELVFRGSLGQEKRGVAAFLDYVRYVRGALAEYACVLEEAVVEGSRVFARMLFRGRHVGRFEGVEPTGRTVAWAGAALFHLEGGRIRELWVLGDRAALREQLERP